MESRRDSFGLRAIVLVVFLGSALRLPGFGPAMVAGDLLFVLAGFLVTKTLMNEYRYNASRNRGRGWVELPRFYATGALKYLPTTLIVIATTLFFAHTMYSKELAQNLGARAVAAALGFVNVLFLRQGVDAFNHDHPQSPFLHFWIPSVATQVLAVLPLIIVAALSYKGAEVRSTKLRHRRRIQLTMFITFLLSFTYMLVETIARPQATYFSTGARVWEFTLGGFFATQRVHALTFGKQLPLVRWLALVVVLATPFIVNSANANYAVIGPVIAFGFLLASNSNRHPDPLSNVFESSTFVGLGRIAYSTMLWSWPIIVLARYEGYASTITHKLLLAGVALIAGAVTYYIIESPVRAKLLSSIDPDKVASSDDADANEDELDKDEQAEEVAVEKKPKTKIRTPQRDRAVVVAVASFVIVFLISAPTIQAPNTLEFGDMPRPQPSVSSTAAVEPVAVFLGASITNGCCTSNVLGWVAQASAALGWDTVNLAKFGTGFSKSNSEGVCANGNCPSIRNMALRAIRRNPDVVVVVASRNECTAVMENPDRVRSALDDTFTILRNGLPNTHIIGVSPFGNDSSAAFPCNERLSSWMESATNRVRGTFLPQVETWLIGHRDWLGNDRVHPNDAGHTQIAKRFVAWFKKFGPVVTHQS